MDLYAMHVFTLSVEGQEQKAVKLNRKPRRTLILPSAKLKMEALTLNIRPIPEKATNKNTGENKMDEGIQNEEINLAEEKAEKETTEMGNEDKSSTGSHGLWYQDDNYQPENKQDDDNLQPRLGLDGFSNMNNNNNGDGKDQEDQDQRASSEAAESDGKAQSQD